MTITISWNYVSRKWYTIKQTTNTIHQIGLHYLILRIDQQSLKLMILVNYSPGVYMWTLLNFSLHVHEVAISKCISYSFCCILDVWRSSGRVSTSWLLVVRLLSEFDRRSLSFFPLLSTKKERIFDIWSHWYIDISIYHRLHTHTYTHTYCR